MFPRTTSKILNSIFCIIFFITSLAPMARAQGLPQVGSVPGPVFSCPVLRGVEVNPEKPFGFTFFVDKGKSSFSRADSEKLIRYFLATLAIPNDHLWVNLSPYEKDRMISGDFSKTAMGMDVLGQDFILKQIMASFLNPDKETGREFWRKVYRASYEKFGTTDIPVDTFNKVWILPEKASVLERGNTAWLLDMKLKVMLESDYTAAHRAGDGACNQGGSGVSCAVADRGNKAAGSGEVQQIIREVVLPALEEEVNQGKEFAKLRQIVYSMALAAWYKKALKESVLSKVYVNRAKVGGLVKNDPKEEEKIFEEYLKTYRQGVFNYIREEKDEFTGETVPRKYFSGGFDPAQALDNAMVFHSWADVPAELQREASTAFSSAELLAVKSEFKSPEGKDGAMSPAADEDPLKKLEEYLQSLAGQPRSKKLEELGRVKAVYEQLGESFHGIVERIDREIATVEKTQEGVIPKQDIVVQLREVSRAVAFLQQDIRQKEEELRGFYQPAIFQVVVSNKEETAFPAKVEAFFSKVVFKSQLQGIFPYEIRGEKFYFGFGSRGRIRMVDREGQPHGNSLVKAIEDAHTSEDTITGMFVREDNGERHIYVFSHVDRFPGATSKILVFKEDGTQVENDVLAKGFRRDALIDHQMVDGRGVFEYAFKGQKRFVLVLNHQIYLFLEDGTQMSGAKDPLVSAIADGFRFGMTFSSAYTENREGKKRLFLTSLSSRFEIQTNEPILKIEALKRELALLEEKEGQLRAALAQSEDARQKKTFERFGHGIRRKRI
ncbi:MAG: hypothetical protein HQL16_05465 [Candidatus Omnitrophica bacterium]|nr:hypothetical protein [Candidatus Omnitrophota bacterium]